jgi:hypothetical protein
MAQESKSISFPGYSFQEVITPVEAEFAGAWVVDIAANPAVNTGVITAGVATLNSAHTIASSGALVDAYWATGRRYGCTAVKDSADVTLSDGEGDSLPTDATAITLCTQKKIDVLPLDGDQLKWIAVIYSNPSDVTAKGSLDMHDAGGSEKQWDLIHYSQLGGCENKANVDGGETNPIAGDDIIEGYVSHDSLTAAKVYVLALIDSTV